jgi:hypothetical protein
MFQCTGLKCTAKFSCRSELTKHGLTCWAAKERCLQYLKSAQKLQQEEASTHPSRKKGDESDFMPDPDELELLERELVQANIDYGLRLCFFLHSMQCVVPFHRWLDTGGKLEDLCFFLCSTLAFNHGSSISSLS